MKSLPKKTWTLGIAVVSVFLILGYVLVVSAKDTTNQDVLLREYPVTKGDITAGVDKTGSVEAEKVDHNFDNDVVIEKVFVSVGDKVKKGDKLASFSKEEIQKQIDEKNKELEKANTILKQNVNAKTSLQLTYDTNVSEIRNASLQMFEKAKKPIQDSIQQFVSQINAINEQIAEIDRQIAELTKNQELPTQPNSEDNAPESLSSEQIAELERQKQLLIEQIDALNPQLTGKSDELSILESQRKTELEIENNKINQDKKLHDISIENANTAIHSAQLEVDKINQEIKALKNIIANNILKATTDGVVSEINYKENQPTSKDKAVVVISNLDKLKITLKVDQNEILDIETGQRAQIKLSAYQNTTLEGLVAKKDLSPTSEGGKVVYKVTIEIDTNSADIEILEGMSAQVSIIKKQVKDVLILSNKAIQLKNNKQVVYLKNEQNELVEKEIITGFSDGKRTEVISGLNEGDIVIVEG